MQVEEVPEVEDSVAVGLRVDADVRVVLFVKVAASSTPSPSSSTVANALGSEAQKVSSKREYVLPLFPLVSPVLYS